MARAKSHNYQSAQGMLLRDYLLGFDANKRGLNRRNP
jgi:hypothetical protein